MIHVPEFEIHENNTAIVQASYVGIHGSPGTFGPSKSLVFRKEGEISWAAILHDFHPSWKRIELSIHAFLQGSLNQHQIAMVATYVYDVLGCETLMMRFDYNNERSQRLCEALGGKTTVIENARGMGKHECVHVITADDARQSKFWRT